MSREYSGLQRKFLVGVLVFVFSVVVFSDRAHSQTYGVRTGARRGGAVTFEPKGPGVLFGALDPAVKKWYVPQELYQEYQWKTWEYSNYARVPYERYVDTAFEGDYFYDLYGNYVTKGWLIYDWRQQGPAPLGNALFKDGKYNDWFSRVLVASDSKGEYYYSITVGDQIRTTLTPMTFSKPSFNGLQLDFASDKYEATVLLSRISSPALSETVGPSRTTNSTNMLGGRATAQIGDFVKIGATYINAHNTRSTLDAFDRSSFKGTLGEGQVDRPVTAIAVVLSDDSPEDEVGGTALFEQDIIIVRQDFETGVRQTLRLRNVTSDPTRWPIIEGGFQEEGFLSADGTEKIVINYDFTDPAYTGPNPTEIVKVTFDLVLANDFKVQVWSDRQTGKNIVPVPPLTGEIIDGDKPPVLLDIARADDNIKDSSNRQRIVFDYGLPTANQIYGFTLEANDIRGFDLYAEYDVNHRFRQYPNLALFTEEENFDVASSRSEALMANLSYRSYPWFFFGEVFSMDPDYSTSPFIVNTRGNINYDVPTRFLYEFVEDNDDQDRTPDWTRMLQGGPDGANFPGWDENNDFISDFNQNDNKSVSNSIPDYEEPFLRYSVDRPEFLFGIDLNNNNWIDRFENDDEPDFPYKRDHRGYNAYIGASVAPDARLSVGQTREELLSSEKENITTYGLFTLDKDYQRLGRLRVFEMLKRTKDNIPDDRREPPLLSFTRVQIPPNVPDILPAQDTWVNTLWIGLDYTKISNLNIINKIKYETFSQQSSDPRALDKSPLNDTSSFFGLINKADYTYSIGDIFIRPRFKSEFLRQTPFLDRDEDERHWSKLFSLILEFPVLQRTLVELGAEFVHFTELRADEDELLERGTVGPTGDFNNSVLAVQWSTLTDYLGYKLIMKTGFSFTRTLTETIKAKDLDIAKRNEVETGTTTFVIIYAGLQ